jgi:hypothetical protein
MSPSQWGTPTWIFMHTIAEKLKEENFPTIGPSLIRMIIQICNNLPCPECSDHAKQFWAKVKVQNIRTKTDLINLIFVFHNMVNKRKGTLPFKYVDLQYYKTTKLIDTFNTFSRNFNTKGNMTLINQSFHRNMFLNTFRSWLMNNIKYFDM